MVRKELIGRSMTMIKAARREMRKELRQYPQKKMEPELVMKRRLKKLPPSWVDRIIPLPLKKYVKPYAMRMQFSNRAVSVQVYDTLHDNEVVTSVSSRDEPLKLGLQSLTDTVAAARVAEVLGDRLKEKGIPGVTYFRNRGELYHGKRKAFLDKLRETGVKLI